MDINHDDHGNLINELYNKDKSSNILKIEGL